MTMEGPGASHQASEGLAQAQGGLPRHELWAILAWATGRDRSWLMARLQVGPLLADLDRQLVSLTNPAERALIQQIIRRRLAGEPLAYLLGFREFYGHRFWVNPAVLIPRAETELLLERALHWLTDRWALLGRPLRLLDLGTGSGCLAIGLALAAQARGIPLSVVAIDRSAAALQVARNNALWLKASVACLEGSWLEPARGRPPFDLIVSNPPYLCDGDVHLNQGDLPFEPMGALTGLDANPDGLAAYRAIAARARDHLEPDGCLMVEHGYDQQPAVIDIFLGALTRSNVRAPQVSGLADLAGLPRLVIAQL